MFFKQALFAAKAGTKDKRKAKEVLDRVAQLIPDIPLDSPPPETARLIYRAVREVTRVADPFETYKERSIRKALSLYGEMKSMVKNPGDPLQTTLRVAIAGNVIDLGANPDFDLEKEMKGVMDRALSLDNHESFRQSLEKARTVLYLGDNAGE